MKSAREIPALSAWKVRADNGSFVYRYEDTGPSSREDGFDSHTGRFTTERSEAWLSRLLGVQEIAGSNPAILTDKRDVG